ncbi:hypothetical protein L1987_40040 [Smallanthus sonchifolius]|uniref:Uncharacterized protein n=1 Tax=Smallanthus sonchifolius TaxID=185202 RepID=A0ACB9GT56_9ASTR|nr:hypothetical protein L1987_40040 [Smallanthus sonchifolius]
MIVEEIHAVIVSWGNVHKNYECGCYSAFGHPYKGDIGRASRNYQHHVNVKRSILYNDFSHDEEHIYFDDNSKVETGDSYNDYNDVPIKIEVEAIMVEVMGDVNKVEKHDNDEEKHGKATKDEEKHDNEVDITVPNGTWARAALMIRCAYNYGLAGVYEAHESLTHQFRYH